MNLCKRKLAIASPLFKPCIIKEFSPSFGMLAVHYHSIKKMFYYWCDHCFLVEFGNNPFRGDFFVIEIDAFFDGLDHAEIYHPDESV